jgi:hypothetical protein
MEIQINNCPVDFEFKKEYTINDVINFISDWSSKKNLIFTEVAINNSTYSVDNLPNVSISTVKTLNCFVQSKADLIITSLDAGVDYCSKVQKFLKESIASGKVSLDEIKNISAGIDWVVEVITKISDLLNVDVNEIKYKDNSVAYYFERLIVFKKDIQSNVNPDWLIEYISKNNEIFPIVSGILKMLLMSENMKSLVIQSIDSPDILLKSILNIKNEIPVQIKNLEEIAVSYQTRKDDLASEKLKLFIDFIFNYSRTCYQIAPVFEIDLESLKVNDIPLSGKNSEIQTLLYNIIDAMENNDIISLSDILEYEMKSSLENLGAYIDLLINAIEKNN